jgi:preprotein translocase subunit YajC
MARRRRSPHGPADLPLLAPEVPRNPMMPDLLARIPFVFAENAPAAGGNPNPLTSLLPLIAIPFLFYFIIMRPKQLEERKRQAMINALKKNDKVLTLAGIYGTVVSVDNDQDRVVLRVDDNVKIAFSKTSVLKVIDVASDKEKEKEKVG